MSFFLNYFHKIRTERFFLFTAGLFGLLFLFITPPFQVPDEPNHFYRAWQISEGGFISVKQDKRVGGYLPSSLENVSQPFFHLIWAKDMKTKDIDISGILKTPLNYGEKKFYDFNNTAMYSPVCYLPAAFTISILRVFNTPPLYAFYGARLTTLFFWIILVYYAIKIIPVYKWLFSFLALLPMSLFINMSISADVVTNAVCFLFIAFVLNCAYDDNPFNKRRLLLLLLLVFLLVSVKSIYAPLILVLFIIPKNKFKSKKDHFLKLVLLLFSAFIFSGAWNALLNPLYVSYEDYNPDFRNGAALVNGANMPKQIDYVLHHGFYIADVLLRSFKVSFDMYFKGYIGTFGWLDTQLPWWFINCAYLLIVLIALFEKDSSIRISWWQKCMMASAFLITWLLVFLSQHLIWNLVGGDRILNIQGRYLIPFTPLLFFLFHNKKIPAKKITVPFVMIAVLLSLCYALQIIYSRYH
jgi:uncharacterized membrane protein